MANDKQKLRYKYKKEFKVWLEFCLFRLLLNVNFNPVFAFLISRCRTICTILSEKKLVKNKQKSRHKQML